MSEEATKTEKAAGLGGQNERLVMRLFNYGENNEALKI